MEVVDLVGSALDSADPLVDVVELSVGALGAVVVDQVESWFTDTSVQDPVLIYAADGNAFSMASVS